MNISVIENLEIKYSAAFSGFNDFLESLEQKYNRVSSAAAKDIPDNTDALPDGVVIPDRKYVETLFSGLSRLKNVLGGLEYRHFEAGLKDILENGDFDDSEDIIISVHNLIEKYIYGSDTKVSVDNWKILEKYICSAGYAAVPVQAGDNVTPFKKYFNRPIATRGGKPDTIKHIQLQPYTLKYWDGEEIKDEIKLCGKCTYYNKW